MTMSATGIHWFKIQWLRVVAKASKLIAKANKLIGIVWTVVVI